MSGYRRSNFLETVILDGGTIEKDLSSSGFNSHVFKVRPSKFYVYGKYVGRPDLISIDVYGSQDYWWMLMKYNGVCDVFSELVDGTMIELPSLSDLNSYIANNKK